MHIKIVLIIVLIIAIGLFYIQNTHKFANAPLKPLGSNKCTWGPSYWCASEANAKECNYSFANCTSPKPPGSNKCTWGPSYWCASEENAKECGFPFASCIDYEKVD